MPTIIHFVNPDTDHTLVVDPTEGTLKDSGAYVSENSSWKLRDHASFYVRPGLDNVANYSFESKKLPGYFLTADESGEVFLLQQEPSREYAESATFTHSNGTLSPVGEPGEGISLSVDGQAVSVDLTDPAFSAVTFQQAEKKWKDSYTISFEYFGKKTVHLTLEDDQLGFRSFSFWDDFDQQDNTSGWYLDYTDNNTPHFTIQNVSDGKARYLALADDNRSIELIDSVTEDGRPLNEALWRAEELSARGDYVIVNKKAEKDGKNGIAVDTDYVDDETNITNSIYLKQYDALTKSDINLVLRIDERFIPTLLRYRDIQAANSLLRRSNGLASMGMIIPQTDQGNGKSWTVRRHKTTIELNEEGTKVSFVPHIGVDPIATPDSEAWNQVMQAILDLPVVQDFTEEEQNTIIKLAKRHLSRAYRSYELGEESLKFTSGIVWLKPDLKDTKILKEVDTFIDYEGQTIRAISSVQGESVFSAAFGFLLKQEDRNGDISFTVGDPTAGQSRRPQ